ERAIGPSRTIGTAAGRRSKYVLAPWLQTHPASSRRRNVAHRPSWSARRREERGAFGPQRASSRTGQFALEEFAADELHGPRGSDRMKTARFRVSAGVSRDMGDCVLRTCASYSWTSAALQVTRWPIRL